VLLLCEVALVHTSLVAATPATVVVMVVMQLPVELVAVLVDILALVVIPLPTAMAMLAAVAQVVPAPVIVLHMAIPVEVVLVLLDKALLDQVSATWAATEAVVAKTADQVKIRIIARAFQTGPVVFTVAVLVVLATMLHSVMEYKLEDAGALE